MPLNWKMMESPYTWEWKSSPDAGLKDKVLSHFETNDWHWKTKGLCTFRQESNWNGPISIEFQTYRCWGPLLGLITLDSSSNSEGGMFRFIDSPQRETFLLTVYCKLEIFLLKRRLRWLCSRIDIMFNRTQMQMRLWGIDEQVCLIGCTDTYIGVDCFFILHKIRYFEGFLLFLSIAQLQVK